ncbi:hypothetical protein [Microbacterium xylanilyticum]
MTYATEPDWSTLGHGTDVLASRIDGTDEIRGIVAGTADGGLLVHDLAAQVDEHGHAPARFVKPDEWAISRVS